MLRTQDIRPDAHSAADKALQAAILYGQQQQQ
jgi:hypothetical protein